MAARVKRELTSCWSSCTRAATKGITLYECQLVIPTVHICEVLLFYVGKCLMKTSYNMFLMYLRIMFLWFRHRHHWGAVVSSCWAKAWRPQHAASKCVDLLSLNDYTVLLLLVHTKTICDGQTMLIECPTDHVIIVTDAFYGRLDQITCPHNAMSDTSCSLSGAIDIVRSLCQNQRTCSLEPPGSDPCLNTYKYLRVTYVCSGK